jgi:hypothetical protein
MSLAPAVPDLTHGIAGRPIIKTNSTRSQNMKIARLTGLMLVAIFAMSLVAASMAFAEPEFKPTTATITGASGTSVLEANSGVNKVTCTSSATTGKVTSATLAGGVVVHFLGCTETGETGSNCAVSSTNTTNSGLILTNTLHGVLGLILPKTGTGVALLLLPASGKNFVTLATTACAEETAVSGNVAGEVEPVGVSTTHGLLLFKATGTKQAIKGFDPSTGGTTTAKLTAFATEASEVTTQEITFSVATEVT